MILTPLLSACSYLQLRPGHVVVCLCSNLQFTSLSSTFPSLPVNPCQSFICTPFLAGTSTDSIPAVWGTTPAPFLVFWFCFFFALHLIPVSFIWYPLVLVLGVTAKSQSCLSPLSIGDFVDLHHVPPETPLLWTENCSSGGLCSETAVYFQSFLVLFSALFQFCCIISWSEATRSTYSIHSMGVSWIYPVVRFSALWS